MSLESIDFNENHSHLADLNRETSNERKVSPILISVISGLK